MTRIERAQQSLRLLEIASLWVIRYYAASAVGNRTGATVAELAHLMCRAAHDSLAATAAEE